MEAIGRKRWAIPEGYIPSESSFRIAPSCHTKPPASSMRAMMTRM